MALFVTHSRLQGTRDLFLSSLEMCNLYVSSLTPWRDQNLSVFCPFLPLPSLSLLQWFVLRLIVFSLFPKSFLMSSDRRRICKKNEESALSSSRFSWEHYVSGRSLFRHLFPHTYLSFHIHLILCVWFAFSILQMMLEDNELDNLRMYFRFGPCYYCAGEDGGREMKGRFPTCYFISLLRILIKAV